MTGNLKQNDKHQFVDPLSKPHGLFVWLFTVNAAAKHPPSGHPFLPGRGFLLTLQHSGFRIVSHEAPLPGYDYTLSHFLHSVYRPSLRKGVLTASARYPQASRTAARCGNGRPQESWKSLWNTNTGMPRLRVSRRPCSPRQRRAIPSYPGSSSACRKHPAALWYP